MSSFDRLGQGRRPCIGLLGRCTPRSAVPPRECGIVARAPKAGKRCSPLPLAMLPSLGSVLTPVFVPLLQVGSAAAEASTAKLELRELRVHCKSHCAHCCFG